MGTVNIRKIYINYENKLRKEIKMKKRSEIREAAFMLIFEEQFGLGSCDEIIECAKEADEYDFNGEAVRIFKAVAERSEELDGIIAKYSEKRRVGRIGKVSLAVLRLSIYECLYEPEVPVNVAVSEAVIISQKYSFETDTSFVNGILGSFSRSDDIPSEKRQGTEAGK